MCGIAGFISSPDRINQDYVNAVRRMTRRMISRGPDAEGFWRGDGVVLGHRRLAILDLDARSNQPMLAPDGRYCLVFNGEIYNFRQLRSDLEAQGETFRTTSDTEVLISLYARYGEQMLPKLRGMFAFAIWDSTSRELFLARDPYGIKPLYYVRTRHGVFFASQVKALLATGLVDTDVETAGLAGFFLWGSVPEPWTPFRGIKALPAGSWMRIRNDLQPQKPVCWFNIRDAWKQEQQTGNTVEELQEYVRRAITDSVRDHLVSDVPVSVFLSGGVDSGAISALVSQLGAKVEGITIGFKEFNELHDDEVPVAAEVAAHYGLPHYVRFVSRTEFEQDIPRFIDAMDQPTIDGVNTWFASKAAAERGYKVVLSGVGGDELLYGYSLTREIPRTTRRNQSIAGIPGARRLLEGLAGSLDLSQFHPKLKGIPKFMGSPEGEYFLRRALFLPCELPALMGVERAREGLLRLGGSPPGMMSAGGFNTEAAVCMLDSTLYLRNMLLRDSDWTSMAHSLELRTPFVDAALLNAMSPIHANFTQGVGKRMLAKSPAVPLPDHIVNRPKTGFMVPMAQWLALATEHRDWDQSPILAPRRTPWTRRWAAVVADSFFQSSSRGHALPEAV
jgi:asparagine synthase (glutamine-hydrolysing)